MTNKNTLRERANGLFSAAVGTQEDTPKNTKATKIPEPDQNIPAPKVEPVNGNATPSHGAPFYRVNLKLSPELDGYLRDEAWIRRMSRTELINRILKAYAEEHPHT